MNRNPKLVLASLAAFAVIGVAAWLFLSSRSPLRPRLNPSTPQASAQSGTTARTDAITARKAERTDDARHLDQAQNQFDAGHYEQAIAELAQVKHQDAGVQQMKAWSYFRMGDMPHARGVFGTILDSDPNNNDARAGLGFCALRDNDLDEAERQFRAVIENSASPATTRPGAALEGMGLVRYRQGDTKEAARYLEEALKANPANGEIRDLLRKIRPDPATAGRDRDR